MSSNNETEEEIKNFLTEKVGMDPEEIEERADELYENEEVLLRINAYRVIKRNNKAQPQEEVTFSGAYLGTQSRTDDDGNIDSYTTWLFDEKRKDTVRVNSDDRLVSEIEEPPVFTRVSIHGVEVWEDLDSGYTWQEAADDVDVEIDREDRVTDLVFDYANTVGEVDEDDNYLVIAEVSEVDTIGEFDDTGDFTGFKPVIEDEDTCNLRLVLSEQRTGKEATMKIKEPRDLARLTGIDLDRLLRIGSNKDPQEMRQQINQVLSGEEVIVFARGSAYIEGEEVQDSEGNRRPWLTLSNFDIGFIESLDEMDA